MAIKLFKVDNFHSGLHKEFFIDGESDLEQIEVEFDCELGDKAYTPNGTIYTRHSDEFDGDLWEEIEVSGGSSENSEEEESSKKGLEVFLIDSENMIPLSSEIGENSEIVFENPIENQIILSADLIHKYNGNFSDLGDENNPKILVYPSYFQNWSDYETGDIILPVYNTLPGLNSEYISEVPTGTYYIAEDTPIIMARGFILVPSDISIIEGTAELPEPPEIITQ